MKEALHRNEIPVGLELVGQLIERQFPDFGTLPISRLGVSGSSNVHFALGEEFLVRLPRLPGGGVAIAKECRWMPVVGGQLPIAVPKVVAMGEPELGYSENWSIVCRQSGEHPHTCSPRNASSAGRLQLAGELAEIVAAFRSIEIGANALGDHRLWRSYRGRALADYDSLMRENIENCRALKGLNLDLDAATALWEEALELPGADKATEACRWFHGDIVAENLLCKNGRLTGLLDFGGIGLGDPTVDLHGAWELLDAPARQEFRSRLCVDESEWLRGRAWALAVALMTFPYYWTTMPGRVADRMAMAQSVLADHF